MRLRMGKGTAAGRGGLCSPLLVLCDVSTLQSCPWSYCACYCVHWCGTAAPHSHTLGESSSLPPLPCRVYVEMPGLAAVAEEDIQLQHTSAGFTLTVSNIPGERTPRMLTVHPLYEPVTGAKWSRKGDRITVALTKKDAFTWWDLKKNSEFGGNLDD